MSEGRLARSFMPYSMSSYRAFCCWYFHDQFWPHDESFLYIRWDVPAH